jgi:hypothetical protein
MSTGLFFVFLFFEIAGIIFCLMLFIVAVSAMIFWFNYRHIKCRTITMHQPVLRDDKFIRQPAIKNELNELLVFAESHLRKMAYRNVPMQTGKHFFDDSDMQSAYRLVIIYNPKTKTPLLSARYYSDAGTIAHCLKENMAMPVSKQTFLLDRLSGNISSKLYRRHRNYIFALFYAEVLRENQDSNLIIMARSGRNEKLLASYRRLGFKVAGATQHQEKKHWILSANLEECYRQVKKYSALRVFLFIKTRSFFQR